MSRRRLLALVGVAAVAAAVVAYRGRGRAPARRFSWPVGSALVYDLALTTHDTASLTGAGAPAASQPLGATTELTGALHVSAYRVGDSDAELGVRLVPEVASVVAAGAETLGAAEREALARTEAVVSVRRDGTVTAVHFPPATPEPVQNVLMLAITETAVTLGTGAAWRADEATLQGTAASRYQVVDSGGGQLVLRRARDRYTALTAARAAGRALAQEEHGAAQVTIAGGVLARLEASERLTIGGAGDELALGHDVTTRLSLRRRERAGLHRPVVAAIARAPGELAVRADLEARQLASRIDGLTGDQLEATLRLAATTGRAPDHNRFLWRATALLRADPALCQRLVDVFASPALNGDGRALVADLLVGAGTPAAQAALRDALALPAAFDTGYPMLFQRLGLVDAPDASTLALVRAHALAPGPEGHDAALASLGAVVGKRLAAGDALARADLDVLVTGLAEATTAADAVAHLVALSNVHLPELESTIAAQAAAPAQPVRRAVARALHGQRGDLARTALLGLAGDGDGEVQRQSLLSLAGRQLADGELQGLAALVARGGVRETGYDALLDLVQTEPARPAARAVIEAVLRQPVQNADVLGRARRLLAGADRL